jgi:hypothetical protein
MGEEIANSEKAQCIYFDQKGLTAQIRLKRLKKFDYGRPSGREGQD